MLPRASICASIGLAISGRSQRTASSSALDSASWPSSPSVERRLRRSGAPASGVGLGFGLGLGLPPVVPAPVAAASVAAATVCVSGVEGEALGVGASGGEAAGDAVRLATIACSMEVDIGLP